MSRFVPDELGFDQTPAAFLAMADFDGDGDLDFLDVEGQGFLNDGQGRFTFAAVSPIPRLDPGLPDFLSTTGGRVPVGIGDLNGDGVVDVVTAETLTSSFVSPVGTTSQIWVWYGTTPGTFASLGPLPVQAGYVSDIAVLDVDGDGQLDIVVSGFDYLTAPGAIMGAFAQLPLRVYRGLGTNSGFVDDPSLFLGGPVLALGGTMLVVDWDADGDQDLLVGNYMSPVGPLRVQNVPGGLQAAGTLPAPGEIQDVGDVNGDGVPDLLSLVEATQVPGSYTVHFGPLTPTSSFTTFPSANPPVCGRLLDLDLDGDEEIITGVRAGGAFGARGVQVWDWSPAGPVRRPADDLEDIPLLLYSANIDGDADEDLLCYRPGLPVRQWGSPPWWYGWPSQTWYLRGGTNWHSSPTAYVGPRPFGNPNRWLLTDWTGDGDVDVFVAASRTPPAGGIAAGVPTTLMENDGRGRFRPEAGSLGVTSGLGFRCWSRDVDGDGDQDLVTTETFFGTFVTLDPSVGAAPNRIPVLPFPITSVEAGDVNGDGTPDLVVAGTGFGVVVLFSPLTALSVVQVLGPTASTTDLALVDVDGDGDLDLAVADPLLTASGVYLNDGLGGFNVFQPFPSASVNTANLAAFDLNGDGLDDLVAGPEVFLSGGSPILVSTATLPGNTPVDTHRIDLEGDGIYELVDANGSIFSGPGYANLETFPWSGSRIEVFDADGDGDPDLMTDDLTVLFNTHHNLRRRSVARIGRPLYMDIRGGAGLGYMLAVSLGEADIAAPPFGRLLIDPTTLVMLPPGVLSATGQAEFRVSIPNDPALIGVEFWSQAAVFTSMGLLLTSADSLVVEPF